jgi:D-alanyl-D-alanine carboxypeptidase (penicillin-binding protein 5/6)
VIRRFKVFLIIIAVTFSSLPAPGVAYAFEKSGANPKTVSTAGDKAETFARHVKAPSAILVDIDSGEILWDKNADKHRSIASTTKMMTAILAIENGHLNDTVSIGKNVLEAGKEGGIRLSTGEQIKLKDLLYALMLNSANDSAVAIAEHISGSVKNFAKNMNNKAKSIGALNTNFETPHGLDKDGQYSTARDLSIIARYCLKNKVFADIVSTEVKTIKRSGVSKIKKVRNRNELLFSYEGAKGVKTGHTNKAGYCLVSLAKRNNISLLGVVLGAKTQKAVFDQSATLLDDGFNLYEKRQILKKGVVYKTISSKYGQNIQLTVDKDVAVQMRKASRIKIFVWSDNSVDLPVKAGTKYGRLAVMKDGKIIAQTNLVSQKTVKSPPYGKILMYYCSQVADSLL